MKCIREDVKPMTITEKIHCDMISEQVFQAVGKPAYDEDVEEDTANTPGRHCRCAGGIREQL